MLKEFRDFAMRGNVIDLAVGVVIGGAFGKIVTSLVGDVIMPLVGGLTGGTDFSQRYFYLGSGEDPGTLEKVRAAGGAYVAWGPFLQNVIDFLIIAAAIFAVIKAINVARARFERGEEPSAAPPPEDVKLLREIRDLLATRR
ncbi:MAG: large conductance mechanosensitive channel protein MscL [Planctomycetota bacterium]|nr:MAG: large conductance mechanosensitive channel protein MscL [Planctomycetota bacterium]